MPPEAFTRKSPPPVAPNRMDASGVHAPPSAGRVSQMICGGPPTSRFSSACRRLRTPGACRRGTRTVTVVVGAGERSRSSLSKS